MSDANEQTKAIYLKDYQAPAFTIAQAFIYIDLQENKTQVKAILEIARSPQTPQDAPLVLDGDELTLKSIALNGKPLANEAYHTTSEALTIPDVPDEFKLETTVEIDPKNNTRLMGIYQSGKNYASQCESHGFRRITYFIDRPDVLVNFTTTITADKEKYPHLLSNGNLVDQKDLEGHRHFVKWVDPFKKPAYLFAFVAGHFDLLEDHFKTLSGRNITLQIYVEKGKKDQAYHAMACLKRAMAWDEENYGREYDLDRYMIVSVNDFNFGAMENKGLNIFNDCYVLAKPETATDEDYMGVESVIGHEYFHNWSGNRVTVRDWFQITLKEGLTVLRDQDFTADVIGGITHRIQTVKKLRDVQFSEDEGPMAHPIRPDHYIEINNFYTATVYNKGAEVIRMIKTILGQPAFRKAMDLYFSRNDGKAVTTEDFIKAMEDSSGIDLTQFKYWYSQAGTPVLEVTDHYEPHSQTYTLHIKQSCPETPADEGEKKPFHIPVAFGLLDEKGRELSLEKMYESGVLHVKSPEETFTFKSIKSKPIPSLLRHFSAPVKLNYHYSDSDLITLSLYDTDEFNRWDSAQTLINRELTRIINDQAAGKPFTVGASLFELFQNLLKDNTSNKGFIAQALSLPTENYLIDLMAPIDINKLHDGYTLAKKAIAERFKEKFLELYEENSQTPPSYTRDNMAKRQLKHLCLDYLLSLKTDEAINLAYNQFSHATHMTDKMGSLSPLIHIDCPEREKALQSFYSEFENEALVLDKWFGLQARADLPSVFEQVKQLTTHPKFNLKNPNRVRALIGNFCAQNPVHFHQLNGEGYRFLVDHLIKIDKINPMIAGRLITPLIKWKKFDKTRQDLMKKALIRLSEEKLSKDLYEIVLKSLT